MARIAFIHLAFLAAVVPLQATFAWESEAKTVFRENGFVREFYGVPLDLTIHDLEQSDLNYAPGWAMGEGVYSPRATIKTRDGVELVVDFTDGGDLHMLKTISPEAVGPRGVRIGASLDQLKKAWPEGTLIYGIAEGPYVTFTTGTNVYFQFAPNDMPPGSFDLPPVPQQTPTGEWVTPKIEKPKPDFSKLKVIEIRISSRDKK